MRLMSRGIIVCCCFSNYFSSFGRENWEIGVASFVTGYTFTVCGNVDDATLRELWTEANVRGGIIVCFCFFSPISYLWGRGGGGMEWINNRCTKIMIETCKWIILLLGYQSLPHLFDIIS